eukprot:CAMPEP_0196580314 /NCGR_PEP_ID=MMETSP1081-20130531/28468_1 /TAXON_ID=36882 /ORGANISM="Pyramimonas amylifera, Strain CCMP720" /LENGTH=248 /DNA_ID=CAMNT_0041900153 /DNA_START=91 /DNA_END=837 /DNA_ORIENTATION=+
MNVYTNLQKDTFYKGPGAQSRVAMYTTLLFYTVGVFTVAYMVGGQSLSFTVQEKDVKIIEARAQYLKEQTRQYKQLYVALSNTPVGTMPNCPVCPVCAPSGECDSSGCAMCASSDASTSKSGSTRHLLDNSLSAHYCPPCPSCPTRSTQADPVAARHLLQSPEVHTHAHQHAQCDKEAMLREIASSENEINLIESKIPANFDRQGKKGVKIAQLKTKHNVLVECLKTAMPATGEAYELAMKARGPGTL